MSDGWMIDELAHAGPEHLDPERAAGYDRKQGGPDPPAAAARLIYDFRPWQAGEVFERWLDTPVEDPALG